MAKKKRAAVAADNEEGMGEEAEDAVEVERPLKKKKKRKRELEGEEEAEATPAASPVVGAGKRQRQRSAASAEAAPAEAEDEAEERPKKKKKAKGSKAVAAEAEAEAAEEEDEGEKAAEEPPPAKRKKKDKKAKAAAAAADEEAAEEAPGDGDAAAGGAGSGAAEEGGCCVFVGGIPWSIDEETLRKDFGECGEVTDVNLLKNRDSGLSRGIAFVSFADEAAVQNALKFDGDDYAGRTLKVTRAESRERSSEGKASGKGKGPGSDLEIFIKHLSSHTEESDLRAHFSGCGDIAELSLPTRVGGKCKGFAWITFADDKALKKALKLHGSELKGFALEVEKAGQHKLFGDVKGKGKGKGKGKAKGKGKGKSSEFEVFCNNLSYETSEESLRKYFKDCGEIDRMHMPTKVAGKCMGFAWITFRTKEGIRSALDKHQEEFEGRRIKVEKSGQHLNGDAGDGNSKGE